jgi:hypothetical protein
MSARFPGSIEPVMSPRPSARARSQTQGGSVDRDYETLRINMHTLFGDLALTTQAA